MRDPMEDSPLRELEETYRRCKETLDAYIHPLALLGNQGSLKHPKDLRRDQVIHMVSDIARRLHDLKSRHGFSEYFRSGWKILLGDEAWNLIDKGDDLQGTLNTLADALLKQHPTTA